MRFLLINTCGLEGIVALADDGAVLAVERLPGRGTSEHLMPAVKRVLGDKKVSELAGIGVVIGPGSFTGVRVGLSAAKGFCEASGAGMVAMSRLQLVAAAGGRGGDSVALLDGGRGEFYAGVYRSEELVWERLVGRPEAEDLMRSGAATTCEARVAEALGGTVKLVDEPGAEEMLAAVLKRVTAGEWSDVASVDANYLRRTDAEILVHGR